MNKIYSGGEVLIERYEIVRYLDEGGMQEVYLATDQVFQRNIVVKVPKNDSAIKRFKRSAILSSRVTHPNVASTYDFFEDSRSAHLVEEFLDGGNLADALLSRVEVVDPHLTARFMNHVARGLAAAHHAGVIHRDLKPNNIMLQGSLSKVTAKITDFGVARMAQESVALAVEGGDASITTSKTAVGLIPYMAPELINEPREVRAPSDIWAIGAVTYEMLSGMKPFGDGIKAVHRILGEENVSIPDPIGRARDYRDLGAEIFEIIALCLNRDESRRPNADQLVQRTSALCYGSGGRRWGTVISRVRKTGTIEAEDGEKIFFHANSVYGPLPKEGDRVLFASFPGSPRSRAQPVVKAK